MLVLVLATILMGSTRAVADWRLPEATRQLVVVTAPTWNSPHGALQRWRRSAAGWSPVGAQVEVGLGHAGLAWGSGIAPREPGGAGPDKREGDARSPAGAFALLEAFGELPRLTRGTRMPVRAVSSRLRCVDDPSSTLYNQLTDAACGYSSAEPMARVDSQYTLGLVVAHNRAPVRSGAGSCIFLHVAAGPGATTPGCTVMDPSTVAELIAWLDPDAAPLLVQLPAPVYAALRARWRLP